MLERLSIENIALIDKLEVEFSRGLNVLTGETGAGKSIIIDSLSLALGGRADRELISSGSQSARVSAFFDISGQSLVADLLEKYGLSAGSELMLTRELSADGKNVCRINGRIVTLGILREITAHLVDIYGQHEHQSLLDSENHLSFLDNYAHADLRAAKQSVAEAYAAWTEAKAKLKARFSSPEERNRAVELLDYQIREIENAGLHLDEDEELRQQRLMLQNARKISETLNKVCDRLFRGTEKSKPASEAIRRSAASLEQLTPFSEEFGSAASKLDELFYMLEDIRESLEAKTEEISDDPTTLERVEDRIDEINSLKRKYGKTIEDIFAYQQKCSDELAEIRNSEAEFEHNKEEEKKRRDELRALSLALSEKRHDVARIFTDELIRQLNEVGMKNVRFEVRFNDAAAGESYTENGLDTAEFLFSANLGQDVKPLARIISGGELSRFMLAVKSITAAVDRIPTMIFDEIDTGISGKMAQIIGRKIARIASVRQVICITHLPQIASMADRHYFIEKNVVGQRTVSTLRLLDGDGRVCEIARLAGGDCTAEGKAHAVSILNAADDFKKTIKF
ncbi:MAG: DNA repair protein RecN [Eubacteriales bacterium]|nr:DNA repair protein RecN [Eubacteriales bacterium]